MCGHPSARVLSKEETNDVDKMTRAGIAPKQILSSLRQKNPNLQVVARNIYNAKGKILRESLAGRSSIQVLYEELGKGGFTFDIKRDGMDRVTHLFFVHPTSVKLSRSYSSVFVMDCTYKTNRYHMPLLEIIGVTSFNTSFFSSFAFLKNEGYEDYVWALNAFSKVLGSTCQPTCTGEFVATMGLPCAHMMVYWKDTSLPLGAIHSQWRIDIRSSLFVEDEVNQEENGIFGLFSELQNKYNQLPLIEREDTREKLSQLVGCSTPLVFEPNIQVSKGRPSGVRKRKVSSTRRDPSGFEFVEASRKCSICRDIKHNSRTCPMKNRSSLDDGRSINLDDGGYSLIDLNMAPPNDNSFGVAVNSYVYVGSSNLIFSFAWWKEK